MYDNEIRLKKQGYKFIAGVDEVGRGPLIGPVVAAAVILPDDFELEGLTDSKKLSESKRELYFDYIVENALAIGLGKVTAKKIDEINIYEATKLAMKKAISKLEVKPDYVLIDGNMKFNMRRKYESIIKGDGKSISIAAASVIAKVTRDRMLVKLDKKYPMYGFKDHKGYPTKKHVDAIYKYGIIEKHRKSFKPISEILKEKQI